MEIFMTECNHCEVEVGNAIKHLGQWMAPEGVTKGLVNMMNSVFVEPEPYGVVLVIAPWNYPFSLVVLPLIGAIAAGWVFFFAHVNCVHACVYTVFAYCGVCVCVCVCVLCFRPQ